MLFLAYRRLATFTRLPLAGHGPGSEQSFLVDPKKLDEAQERDAAADDSAGRGSLAGSIARG